MNVVVAKKTETPIEQLPPKQASLIQLMAAKYNMEPSQYANAIKKTAMPGNATNEEFAAFLMVAHEYKLNPLLKEIYAFPKKGGGIAPMVSIDGWVNIINSNAMLEGFGFEMHHDEAGQLLACTCTMKRKDRSMPTVVTEYLAECIRGTEPWKMKYRMLRHKALIQAARYCFGLSGIYDEDEAQDQALKDITPASAPARPKIQDFAPSPPAEKAKPEAVDPETGEIAEYGSPEAYNAGAEAKLAKKPKEPPAEISSFPHLADAWNEGWDSEEAPQ